MVPVRTGLDNRIMTVAGRIDDFGKLGRQTYELAMETLEGNNRSNEIQRNREKARKLMSELSDDLLLILTLNQPLSKDLRVIASYMRAIDVLERTVRHARDVGSAAEDIVGTKVLGENLSNDFLSSIRKMYSHIVEIDNHVFSSMVELIDVDLDLCKNHFEELREITRKTNEIILELKGKNVGGREGRILHLKIINRMERTVYNLIRLCEVWHHAMTTDWVTIEEL